MENDTLETFFKKDAYDTIIGALFDVSGSMEEKLRLCEARDHVCDQNATRASMIFTTLLDISQDVDTDKKNETQIFACAFGLKKVAKCDLLQLLEHEVNTQDVSDIPLFIQLYFPKRLGIQKPEQYLKENRAISVVGHEPLIALLKVNGAPYAERHIRDQLDPNRAGELFMKLTQYSNAIPSLIERLPLECKDSKAHEEVEFKLNNAKYAGGAAAALPGLTAVGTGIGFCFSGFGIPIGIPMIIGGLIATASGGVVVGNQIEKKTQDKQHEAVEEGVTLAETILKECKEKLLERMQQLKLCSLTYVQDLIYNLSDPQRNKKDPTHYKPTPEKIEKLVHTIEPHIYGDTPMVEALKAAFKMYEKAPEDQNKVLFILSDGESTDGDPVPICEMLQRIGVRILCCFLSESNVKLPRHLFHEPLPGWTKGQLAMFKMSSEVTTNLPAISFLQRQKWSIPETKGSCRLFLQANDPEIIKEFSNIVKMIFSSNDALFNMITHINLEIYISKSNTSFKPESQVNSTCYAHAIATVYHLVMNRIVGRDGGVPSFKEIKDELIGKYISKEKVKTRLVIGDTCSQYRLHFEEVDEIGAREAINALRPVVATFRLSNKNWSRFKNFFEANPTGKLPPSVLEDQKKIPKAGHAVVLTRCCGNNLRFMNSWGTQWADGGFFTVLSGAIKFNFFDISWKEEDLLPSEIEAWKHEKEMIADKAVNILPEKAHQVPYQCPECKKSSLAKEYIGNLFSAKCPKCSAKFKPTIDGLMQTLYMQ